MRVVVVGGGLIGQGIVWRLAEQGADVVVIDRGSPHAASKVGAGLLIPAGGRISRHHYALRRASADLYPSFVAQLESDTGMDCGYHTCGSLTVAFEPGAEQALKGLSGCLKGFDIESTLLDQLQCRQREPALGTEVAGGFYTDDHQVDPIKLLATLTRACLNRGVEFVSNRVVEVAPKRVVLADGTSFEGDRVVLANGAWLAELMDVPVYPVKGEVISLQASPELLRHNLHVQRERLYVANRGDGRYIVGATEEECGFDTTVTAKESLHQRVCRLVPALADLQPVEAKVGFRPKVGDGLPVMGEYQGVVLAGAHYQNGILQTPIAAKLVSDFVLTGRPDELMQPFLPTRDMSPRHRKTPDKGGRADAQPRTV
jgi:glycine oxidase